MHARAEQLMSALHLQPHPEGGHYGEVYRSDSRVQPRDERRERPALTTIYFLLTAGEVSCWHRVRSDEAWHYYEGDPVELLTMDGNGDEFVRHLLGPVSHESQPVHVVPANTWQAARSTGTYTLVGCTVGPGFEFEDFRLLRDDAQGVASELLQRPQVAPFL